ncbi:MAG: efflux RND transporter periplasmic adaptor subunit, partial [Chloroflexota bacterium]|nr:efflux RND transporter periplasmic adaptor subunit [Chloroflexota bacterium]
TVAEAPASVGAIRSLLTYSGSVLPRWTVNIMARTSGPIVDLKALQGQRVQEGDVIAVVDHRSMDDQVAQARANVASAKAKLNSLLAGARPEDVAAAKANVEAAHQRLAAAQSGGRAEAIAQAQAKLDADQASLNKLLAGPNQQDVTNARLAVEAAKDNLFAQQTTYDRQVAQGMVSREQRQAVLDVAQTQIDQANTALAKLTAPPRPEDVDQARAVVTADRQALALAKQPNRPEDIEQLRQALVAQEAQAAKASSPYTRQDIAQAQAAVDVAKASLSSAQTAQSDATISAPAAGIISDVPVAVGSMVGPNSPVASLISPDLEVDVAVDENQVSLIRPDLPAQVLVAGGSSVDGRVLLVAPQADAKTRKYTVKVVPASAGSPLRAGMSATVKIQAGQQSNVLLVPAEAIIQRGSQQVVFVDDAGRAKMVAVRTGVSNGQKTQVVQGLQPGAQVILPGSLTLADGDAVARAASSPGPAPSGPSASKQ